MKRLIITTFVLLCSLCSLFAQEENTQEMHLKQLKAICVDSILSPSYYHLQKEFQTTADASNFDDMKVSARNMVVMRYYLTGNTDSLKIASDEMKIIAKQYNDTINYYTCWGLLLNNYILTGKIEQAITEAKTMENEARTQNSIFGLATSMTSAGESYLYLGLYEEAISMLKNSLLEMEKMSSPDHNTLCNNYYSLILATTHLGDYNKVFDYCAKIDSISHIDYEQSKNLTYISYLLVSSCSRVIAYSLLGNLNKAEKHFRTAQDYFNMVGTQQDYFLEATGTYYEACGRYEEALEAYQQASIFFSEMGLKKEQIRFIREKAEIFQKQGNYREACLSYSRYISSNDSLVNANTFRQLNEFVVLHDLNGIELERKNLELKVEHERQSFIIYISLILIFLLFVFVLFFISEVRLNRRLKKSEKELIVAKEKAEESDKLKSAFLANMSHEIRTPLNSIVGFSDLISMTEDKEEQQQYKEIIKINSDVLLTLVNDVLDLSKIEAGVVELNYKEFDLVSFLSNLYTSFLPKNKKKGLNLLLDSPYSKCTINYDIHRLTQLYTNFVTNAYKFTNKGDIVMGYREENNGIKIFVSDTGIGISEENKPYIFDRFFKINDFSQGNGLGMAIAKAIAVSSGGSIGVDSKEGEGSLFWVWLPCKITLL